MGLRNFLSSKNGKRFYNVAYCWGACLVILGAVFKIAHMPYDNILLMVGLFTEVFIFFISGFDEPPTEYKWERVFPELNEGNSVANTRKIRIDEELSARYTAQMQRLEENVAQLNAAYEKQLKQVQNCTDAVKPEAFTTLQDETAELAAQIKKMNEQYERLLSAMNVKK